MALLSNGLYRDSRYSTDCTNKINYLDIITNNIINDNSDSTIITSSISNTVIDNRSTPRTQLCSFSENKYNHIIRISERYHKIIK